MVDSNKQFRSLHHTSASTISYMSSGPGAALFKNALGPVASTSSGGAPALLNRMQTDSGNKAHSGPLRSSKGKGRAAKNAEDGDIGMQDASGASRRGRATRKPSGPMGDRVSNENGPLSDTLTRLFIDAKRQKQ